MGESEDLRLSGGSAGTQVSHSDSGWPLAASKSIGHRYAGVLVMRALVQWNANNEELTVG